MAKTKLKHRLIDVGQEKMISLCETCEHMPFGNIPQSNNQKNNKDPEEPHMYCSKKSFFPDINYSNGGIPFYDVATCDGYQEYNKTKEKNKIRIKRNE